MASKRYYLLINGSFVRTDSNQPIIEIIEDGRIFYGTVESGKNLGEEVETILNRIINQEKENPLYNEIKETSLGKSYDDRFMLKNVTTPLYRLQLDLIRRPDMRQKLDSEINIGEVWDQQRYSFFATEFIKYATLMNYVENKVRSARKSTFKSGGSIFSVQSGEHRVMNVLHAPVAGVFNPYTAFKDLKDFQIFKHIFDEDYVQDFEDIKKPYVFKTSVMRGQVPVLFATSTDLLAMCGVKHKEAISAGNIHRLLGGMILRLSFGTIEDQLVTEESLQLPTNLTLYNVIDPFLNRLVDSYPNSLLANEAIKGTDYVVSAYNTTVNYASEAFPSLEGARVGADNKLVQQLRSAEFVY